MGSDEGRGISRWTVTIPFAGKWLTANPRRSGAWRERATVVRDWRVSSVMACRAAKLPTGIVGPVSIHAVCYFTGRAPVNDTPNLYPTIKACIDGLTPERTVRRKTRLGVLPVPVPGYGFLVDDSDKQIPKMPTWELMPTFLQPRVEMTITEVADA